MFWLLLLLAPCSNLRLDLAADDWFLQADIPVKDLDTVLKVINKPFRAEVANTSSIRLNGRVPGYALEDLHARGIVSDPLSRENDVKLRPLARLVWSYSKTVQVSGLWDLGNCVVVFDGIDTVADVIINKVHYFPSHDNQFRRLVAEVSRDFLDKSDNLHIEVVIQSAIVEAGKRARLYPHTVPPISYPAVQHGEKFRNFLRKSPSSFSWDWGPAFAPSGIWRGVSLVYNQTLHVTSFGVRSTRVGAGLSSWCLECRISVRCLGGDCRDLDGWFKLESLNGADDINNSSSTFKFVPRKKPHTVEISLQANLTDVKAWYPINHGKQQLYKLSVTLCAHTKCAEETRDIGFRTVVLDQSPIKSGATGGTKFQFIINDQEVYLKGSNLVPLSPFQTAATPWNNVLMLVEEAGLNMLRVWGGGVYPGEGLLREADRRGILIWQELMFACSLYPSDDRFLESVKQEVIEQATRINTHPSVILFSSNNENKQGLQDNWYDTSHNKSLYLTEYLKLYDQTISENIQDIISSPFLLSSPSNGESAGWTDDAPNCELAGDMHYYNYTRDCLDTSGLPVPRFASEFGFQSFPALITLRKALKKHHFSLQDARVEHRQHLVDGNKLLLDQVTRMFGSYNLSDQTLVHLTQLNQALCVGAEIAHFRRHYNAIQADGRGMNTGVLFWQFNDVWAAPTWSAIDVDLIPKMLYYSVRNLYKPVIGTAHWNGTFVIFNVINELNKKLEYDFDIFLYDASEQRSLYEWNLDEAEIPPKSSRSVFSISVSDITPHCPEVDRCFIAVEFYVKSEGISTIDVAVIGYNVKRISRILANPRLTARVVARKEDRLVVQVNTMKTALWVWLEADVPGVFSRNSFPMYQPELFLEFVPLQMTDECCKIHISSLYNHKML